MPVIVAGFSHTLRLVAVFELPKNKLRRLAVHQYMAEPHQENIATIGQMKKMKCGRVDPAVIKWGGEHFAGVSPDRVSVTSIKHCLMKIAQGPESKLPVGIIRATGLDQPRGHHGVSQAQARQGSSEGTDVQSFTKPEMSLAMEAAMADFSEAVVSTQHEAIHRIEFLAD